MKKNFSSNDKTKKDYKSRNHEHADYDVKKDKYQEKKKYVEKDKSVLQKKKFNTTEDKENKKSDYKTKKFVTNKGAVSKKLEGYKGQFSKKINKYPIKKKLSEDVSQKDTEKIGIRLNRYISNAGICSRREADTLIKTGVVAVNDKIITEMGFRVMPSDIVKYDGQPLKSTKKVYLILNKPKDYVTTVEDSHAKRTVMDLIADATKERVYPVGRLDRNTTGVLLFTNDGDLTLKLTHPKNKIQKTYHVILDKVFARTDMQILLHGVELEDGFAKVDKIDYLEVESKVNQSKKIVTVTLHSGKNQVIRRMFGKLGYKVEALDRVFFAGLTKKGLKRGQWKILSLKEIGFLKMLDGKKQVEERKNTDFNTEDTED